MDKKGNNYLDLLKYININPKVIFEVGARDGCDSITMTEKYCNANIYTYECNPITIDTCKTNLQKYKNIIFCPYGLGEKNELKDFYIYAPNKVINKNLIGASSFFPRPDTNNLILTENIKISTLKDEFEKYNIEFIDILCMDVQGSELKVLKGSEKYINNIKYIIMEQPKPIEEQKINQKKHYIKDINNYIGAPEYSEIVDFMKKNKFVQIKQMQENLFEDNVLYKNILL
jgi:FkbM family methyltransferase